LAIGVAVAAASGDFNLSHVHFEISGPLLTLPTFTINAAIGLALPLFVLTMTSQNAPGLAVLRNSGYNTPIDGPIAITGFFSILMAPFGGSGINLAAITAAICTSHEAHHDPNRRYAAGVVTGAFYIIGGILSASAVSLFAGFPKALSATVAGLALLGAIGNSMAGAVAEPATRDAALVALLVTAADISLFGIGAPFWGLIFGMVVHLGLTYAGRRAA
jgi:benzoate membrane transport protein